MADLNDVKNSSMNCTVDSIVPIEVAVTDTGASDIATATNENSAIETDGNAAAAAGDAVAVAAAAPEVLLRIHPAAPSSSATNVGSVVSTPNNAVVLGSGISSNRRHLPPVVGLPAANGKLKKVNRKEMQKRFKEQLAEVWLVSL